MYTFEYHNQYLKDVKLCIKRGYNIQLLKEIIIQIETTGTVATKNKPHKLESNYKGFWECHIKPDWLLIWDINELEKIATLVRTGTHSDLF